MKQENKEIFGLVAVIIFVALITAAIYLFLNKERVMGLLEEESGPVEVTETETPLTEKTDDKAIRYPLPELPDSQSVQEKEVEVDPADKTEEAAGDLSQQSNEQAPVEGTREERSEALNEDLANPLAGQFERLFLPQALVRNFVVTIDNMTREKLPQRFKFTASPPGKFLVEGEANAEDKFLDPANYERYDAYVALTESVSSESLVNLYIRHYSLFQKAYEEIGYPDGYFNDRLIEVIDHLLATPQVQGTIELRRPKVFYTFADPRLETLSAGQKIMIRIGPENSRKVRAKLRELRQLLTANTRT